MKPDILILKEQENLEKVNVTGYLLFGRFAWKTHIKGGVAAYIKQDLADTAQLIANSGDLSELKWNEAILNEMQLKKRLFQNWVPTDLQMQSWMKKLTL